MLWIAVGVDVFLMIAKINPSGEPMVVYLVLGLSTATWCWYKYGEIFLTKSSIGNEPYFPLQGQSSLDLSELLPPAVHPAD